MSNKTPENSAEKIALVPSKEKSQNSLLTLLVVLIVVFLGFSILVYSFLNDRQIVVNNHKINVLVADTKDSRAKGLGGWNRLGKNQGMLFKYSGNGIYCVWMKDMKFNIDVIWISDNNKVVDIKENLSPDTYPEVFCPNKDAKYFLEIPSGSVSKFGIRVNDNISIDR
ncbi:MAG: DUF192 domain-containing protein [Candidatus Nomurabacteria bacterium]|nr:DUF192 domain-containing protein [Candidatus Saccharibacteria bacterium]USN95169.1 MAG: DUF192 domain-containing protein [Candidatus Nomurabacteria bacterium]